MGNVVASQLASRKAELPLVAGHWSIDPAHSSVGFTIRHLGVSKVRGRFACFAAEIGIGATLETMSVTATVELDSVDTGNAIRDADIRAPHMMDVVNRPAMAFRSTGLSGEGSEWALDGELTIGEVTRPFSLAVTFGGIQEVPGGGARHAGFEARGRLSRTDFGIAAGFPAAILGDVVNVELDLQLLEPRPEASRAPNRRHHSRIKPS